MRGMGFGPSVRGRNTTGGALIGILPAGLGLMKSLQFCSGTIKTPHPLRDAVDLKTRDG